MRNVVLAVIGSQGKVSTNFAASLNRTSQLAEEQEVHIHFDFIEDNTSGVSTALQKNIIANRVLSSPTADGIFFVNPNLAWVPQDFLKLANYNGDNIISGAYVDSFEMHESYSISLEDMTDPEGPEEYPIAKSISMGFVYIPKKVLQGLTQFVDRLGDEDSDDKFYVFFKETIKEGLLQPEDSYFCDTVKSSGFNILVDPTVNCTNNSIMSLRTDYQAYLAKAWIGKMGEDIPQN
jgi:hypothetical protein